MGGKRTGSGMTNYGLSLMETVILYIRAIVKTTLSWESSVISYLQKTVCFFSVLTFKSLYSLWEYSILFIPAPLHTRVTLWVQGGWTHNSWDCILLFPLTSLGFCPQSQLTATIHYKLYLLKSLSCCSNRGQHFVVSRHIGEK